MAEQRLPIVNADDGVWGDILRQYLLKEHYNGDTDFVQATSANGGHKTITVQPGTAAAGTAPLKFASGTLLTTPEAGAIEFNNDKLYFTKTTGPTRQTVATYNTAGSTGDIYYRDASASFTRLAIGNASDVLTVSGGVPTWSAPSAPSNLTVSSFDASAVVTAADDISNNDNDSTIPTSAAVKAYADSVAGVGGGGGGAYYGETIGDGASTSFVISHNLATRDVVISIYDTASYDIVNADKEVTSTNTVTVTFQTAPAINAYRAVVVGAVSPGNGNVSTSATSSIDNELALYSGTGGKAIKRATSFTGIAKLTSGVLTTVTAPTGAFVGDTDAQVLTNKTITKRVITVSSSATPSINTDDADVVEILSLASNITSMTTNLTGTPTNEQPLMLKFKDNGTARTITWGTGFMSSGIATLPITTVASKIHRVFLIYDTSVSKWVCMAADAAGY